MKCIDDILNDYMIEEWFDSQQYSTATARRYALCMKKYIDSTGLSPAELIDEAEEDIRNGRLPRERRIKRHLIKYRKGLVSNGLSPNTVSISMAGVKSFYRNFDIDLPNLGRNSSNVPLEHHKQLPSKEVIRDILEIANIRTKAIILCGCSAGLGVNEIVNLKVGQFNDGYDPETGITTLHIRRQKVQYDYITFLSPETSTAILRYLEWRNRESGTSNGPRQSHTGGWRKVQGDDDYLFVPDSYNKNLRDDRAGDHRQLLTSAIMSSYRRLNDDIGRKHGNWRDIRSHNMRKHFNSALLNAGADIFFVDFLMGHKISSTHEAYYRADPESLKKKYIKYLPFLSIADTEVHTIESEEYRILKEKYVKVEADMAELKAYVSNSITKEVQAAVAKKMDEKNSL